MYLEKIQGPDDVKKLSMEQLNVLAGEMREALFNRLTKTGGHFGPNFGVVEMTIAMHYVFDSPKDKSVVFVTAAVPSNVGFPKANREKAGSQYIDVGIAEEQAVAMCSGIAKNGGKPIFGTNATFIQRTYDQFSQDVCINQSPVTTILNYSSVLGLNDVTHLGFYTISMLSNIPNLVYLAPTCKEEYLAMLAWSVEQDKYPVVISMPGNGVHPAKYPVASSYDRLNEYQVCEKGEEVAVLALGDFFQLGEEAARSIEKETGKKVTLINPRFASGLDEKLLSDLKENHLTKELDYERCYETITCMKCNARYVNCLSA